MLTGATKIKSQLDKKQRLLKNEIYLVSNSLQLMQKMVNIQPKLVQVFYAFQGVENLF